MFSRRSRSFSLHHSDRSTRARAATFVVIGTVAAAAIMLTSRAGSATATAAPQAPAPQGTLRLVPDELRDTVVAPEARGGADQGAGRRRGVPRFPVHGSPGGERHHLQAPRRRRRRQDLQGGALRPRQRHRDRGRRRRRPDRHLLRQPGRRQPALEECRRRQVSGHHGGGRRRGRRARSACPPRLPTSTTTATPICTSRPSAAATCSSRTTASGRFRDISDGLRPRLRRALVGGGVLRLRPRRPPRPLPRQRRPVHDRHARGRGQHSTTWRSRTRSPAT